MADASVQNSTELRGELNDLRQQLRDPQVEKDPLRKREVLRKVIAIMTTGVDTSSIFTEMILACFTTDLVSKKLIYFYLTNSSENNPEVALLSINTLTKECSDESPLVRGLALRSLASLRLPQLFDFLIPVVNKGLSDTSSYVRKTACLSVLKIFRISPGEFHKHRFLDRMLGMLRDSDPLVSNNALAVLVEVSRDALAHSVTEDVFSVTKTVLYHLLNRICSFSEWHQAQIVKLVLRYTPADEEEMFDIMNLLEDRLQSQNSDMILSVCGVFLHLTQNYPAVHSQVYDRLKYPLLTLMSSCVNNEVVYVVLCHVKLLVQRDPRAFQDSCKSFFCHYMEPTYVKTVKIEILAMIATEVSAASILEEFVAYTFERSMAITRTAIEAMVRVALRLPSTARIVMQHFLQFLEGESSYARGKSLAVMKDFLRKYRDIAIVRPFLDTLVRVYREINFTDEESKLALVWVLGELGEFIEDAPYIMEGMCSENLLASTPEFRLQFLTSALTLFFKRPPEMQPVLGAVFRLLINDFSHADVHDQALMYYRLLRQNLAAASKVICSPKKVIGEFSEEQNLALRDKLFEEFNTLAVMYYQPSEDFMNSPAAASDDDDDDDECEEKRDEDVESGRVVGGGMTEMREDLAVTNRTAPTVLGGDLELSEEANIEPHEFQRRWSLLDGAAMATVTLQLHVRSVPNTEAFEEGLEECGVFTLASGVQGDAHKYYLYAQEEGDDSTYFLLELFLHSTGTVNVIVKSDNLRLEQFVALLKRIIGQF